MGLSGSGKSTLLRAVNGLNPVARGRVHGARRRRRAWSTSSPAAPRACAALRRGAVSMVFQQFALLPWRSVVENVALGLELAGEPKEKRLAKAREVLATVNLQDWAEKKVSELSGGMQQRVGLARAFATDAEILLMDEPFSALDPLIRNRLQDELLQLQEKMHCTIVFVSHDLEEAVKLGNTITIMEGGRIVQTGQAGGHRAEAGQRLRRRLRRAPQPAERADRRRRDDRRRRARATRRGCSPPEAPLRDALPLFATSDAPVWVGRDGAIEGRISPRAVCAMLAADRDGGGAELVRRPDRRERWQRTSGGRAALADRAG